MRNLQSSLGCLILLVSVASAFGCFITNCPPGGKRSGQIALPRKCESCGPQGIGRCYGPNICCSAIFGCLIGTPETLPCALEARFTTVCQNPGIPCSGNGNTLPINGQCAGNGICCTSQTCTVDESCEDGSSVGLSVEDESEGEGDSGGPRPPAAFGGSKVTNRFQNAKFLVEPRKGRMSISGFMANLLEHSRIDTKMEDGSDLEKRSSPTESKGS